jgi:uncharacterized membrane protein YraQ (UPF0718 family)
MEQNMLYELMEIATLVSRSFVRIWPYLLITIPLAVVVQMSGAANHIRRAFAARPIPAIILATVVGAFSPFCSCGVIPVVASLLIGGVPLGPVMSFWIASPSMDPEIFFLSVATLGWELALWRLLATLLLSLSAGFLTHLAVAQGWVSGPVMRTAASGSARSLATCVRGLLQRGRRALANLFPAPSEAEVCCAGVSSALFTDSGVTVKLKVPADEGSCHDTCAETTTRSDDGTPCGAGIGSFPYRLFRESVSASLMVAKFMLLALVLEAAFTRYVPQESITALLGNANNLSLLLAVLVGVPLYTSNLTAMPLVGALLGQGMNPSAALAFLIAGPTTTIPAMAAVWGLVRVRVFVLYVGFALVGAIVVGALHHLLAGS